MANIADWFGLELPAQLANKPSPLLPTQTRIGVEVELENVRVPDRDELRLKLAPYWRIERDDSLRGDYALEFIFAQPMYGEDAVHALKLLDATLKKLKTKPACSERCSVHVHVDVRHRDVEFVRRLVALYVLYEEYFFSKVNADRQNNLYCERLSGMPGYIDRISKVLTEKNIGRFGGWISARGDKYSALNLAPVNDYGSIEFRHKEGCYDYDELLDWVQTILSLDKAVQDNINNPEFMTPAYLDGIVRQPGGVEAFSTSVFGKPIPPRIERQVGRRAASLSKRLMVRAPEPRFEGKRSGLVSAFLKKHRVQSYTRYDKQQKFFDQVREGDGCCYISMTGEFANERGVEENAPEPPEAIDIDHQNILDQIRRDMEHRQGRGRPAPRGLRVRR